MKNQTRLESRYRRLLARFRAYKLRDPHGPVTDIYGGHERWM